ncbi:MAG: hypothetical protein LCH36_05510 [Actinobacteria bacterium]|nr:hypothetical protein [Actinomycetota bacterium]
MTDDRFQSVPGAGLPVDTTAEQLAALAATRPDLWDQIWHHPNSYDGLRDWMAQSYAAQQQHGQVAQSGAAAPQPVSPSFEATLRGTDPDANAPSFVTSPNETQAKPRKRRRGLAIVASIAVVALALGGAGTALALTGKLDQWLGGSSSKKNAVPAAEVPEKPSFADGAELRWTKRGADLDSVTGARVFGYLPRMMPSITVASRPSQPVQLDSGVLLSVGAPGIHEAPQTWAMLDAQSGEVIWTKPDVGEFETCVPSLQREEALCLAEAAVDRGGPYDSKIVRVTADGVSDLTETALTGARVIQSDGDGYAVIGTDGLSVVTKDGDIEPQSIEGIAGTGSSDEWEPQCVWIYGAGHVSYLGPSCDGVPAGSHVSDADNFEWALVDGDRPKLIVDEYTQLRIVDAETSEVVCESQGTLPGWYQEPQVAQSGKEAAVLVQKPEGYAMLGLESCEEVSIESSAYDRFITIVGDEVVAFYGDSDRTVSRYEAFQVSSGELVGSGEFSPVTQVAEVSGGVQGALLAHYYCDDCSTAEGSHSLDGYTLVAPAEGARKVTDADIQLVSEEVPEFVPACPGDTILLAWMELTDGWIVVCGVDANTPTYVAYQPGDEGKPRYSNGATDPTGKKAHAAVAWDKAKQRYLATMADGSKLILDYPLGTATLRDATTTSTVNEQERFVRYVFVPMGTKERVIDEVANQNGAFDVKAPKSTAEDQIRYMIEVLEKAYAGRAMLKDALPKLAGCTAGVGGYGDTIAAMQAVRDNRAQLLTALDAMPVDKIPEGKQLLADLTSAIELSHQANVEYVAWAEAANANGCASLSATGKAAADASDAPKAAFATRWNSVVAAKYGVRTFDGWYI